MPVGAEVFRGTKGFGHVRMLKGMWLEFILARKRRILDSNCPNFFTTCLSNRPIFSPEHGVYLDVNLVP